MQQLFFAFAALLASCLLFSCTDSTVIGGDLVDGTQLPLVFTDSLDLELTTLRSDSSLVSIFTQRSNVAALGCLESSYTGDTRASLGLELVERLNKRLLVGNITIDSAVLTLPLNASRQIGDTSATVSLQVLRAAPGSIRIAEPQTSTPLLDAGVVYATAVRRPARRRMPIQVFVGDSIRIDTVNPQLRIPLNEDFRRDILVALTRANPQDSLPNDTNFVAAFPGLIIAPTSCGRTLPAVSLAAFDETQFGVTIYYREGGIAKQTRLGNRRTNSSGAFINGFPKLRPYYQHDFSGSLAARLLSGGLPNDSFAIVQALDGLHVRVDFPDLSAFGANSGVTYADLLLYVDPNSTDLIKPLESLIIKLPNESGDLIDYTAIPGAQGQPFNIREGGTLVRVPDPRGGNDSIPAFRFNITTLFQEFVSGSREPRIFLTPFNQEFRAGQTVFVGPNAGPLRARVRVASTVLP